MPGPNVRAKVESLRPGDRIYLSAPTKNPDGYVVQRLEGPYGDGSIVVIYRGQTYGWDRGMEPTGIGELSLRPMLPGERVAARRAE